MSTGGLAGVERVTVFDGSREIAQLEEPPYATTWTAERIGAHSLVAVAELDDDTHRTGPVAAVLVLGKGAPGGPDADPDDDSDGDGDPDSDGDGDLDSDGDGDGDGGGFWAGGGGGCNAGGGSGGASSAVLVLLALLGARRTRDKLAAWSRSRPR